MTIGIPTFNRPERCQRAIQSVLGQSLPTRCIVANQDPSSDLKSVCKEFEDHPNFKYYESPATKLWENWKFVAEKAIEEGAEFFGWLQDDDLISERHTRRVVRSFDYYPNSIVYLSRLAMAYDSMLGCHWTGNFGPKIPLDLLRGTPIEFPGRVMLPIAYFDGWAMSPAKAFRVGDAFKDMLNDLPDDCDMFTERLDIAYMGLRGGAIADPNIGGYWIMHGRNQSQITHNKVNDEATSCWKWLDNKMDENPDWRENLQSWMSALGNPQLIEGFRKNIIAFKEDSPYIAQLINIFDNVLRASGIAYDLMPRIIDPVLPTTSEIDEWNKSKTREALCEALAA
jgi:glycosyltransferase involved in cell wall biosynthesis